MKNQNLEKQLNKNVLVITAHPDDHLSCAGTLFKLKSMGYQLYEVVLCDSRESGDVRGLVKKEGMSKQRLGEHEKATKILGLAGFHQLGIEDLNLQYSKELLFRLVEIIRETKPEIGFCHTSNDYHHDHIEAAKLSYEAFRIAASGAAPYLGQRHKTRFVLCFEGLVPIDAQVLVDVSEFRSEKAKLMGAYESQLSEGAQRFDQGLAQVRAYQARKPGCSEAEAFETFTNLPLMLFE